MDRNYAAEMRGLAEKAFENGGIPGQIAFELVEELKVTDPDLLDGFLRANAVQYVREFITQLNRSVRAATRHAAPRRAFREAVEADRAQRATEEECPSDDARQRTALEPWLKVKYVVDTANTQLRLLDMNRDHLLFAAEDFDSQASTLKIEAMFLKSLARKVGDGTVGDHYTAEQLTNMRKSLAAA